MECPRQHISLVGDWSVQEDAIASKLGAAVQQVKLAAGNKACHILWTAALSESDAASDLPYYMAATDLGRLAAILKLVTRLFDVHLRAGVLDSRCHPLPA
jgi:hypothetical protein